MNVQCVQHMAGDRSQGRVYRLALKENIESFDPVDSVDETSGILLNLLHRNLFTTDVSGVLVNDLADRVVFDGPAVYVAIKPGIYFNDSPKAPNIILNELTSEDVVYSLQRLKSSARQPWVLENVLEVKAYNRYTVVFFMKTNAMDSAEKTWQRQENLLSLPQCAIYSAAAHRQDGRFAGASTFSVTAYRSGTIELTSTGGYRLDFKVIASDAGRWFYYRQNQLDVYEADSVFRFLQNEKESFKKVTLAQPVVLYGAIVSDESSVLSRAEFRRVLNYRLNRNDLAGKTLMNSYQPADYPVPDIFDGSLPPLYAFDPRYSCDISDAPGNKAETIRIYTPPDRDRQLAAMAIKKVLGDCGYAASIKVVDLSTLLKINNEKRTGIYLLKWVADYPHAENFIIPLFHSRNSGAGGNRSYYKNPRLDELLDRGVVTSQNVRSIEEMIRRDAPWIFIGFSKKQYYINKQKEIKLPMMYTGWNEEVFSTM